MIHILDTSAVMAHFLNEKGGEVVEQLLSGQPGSCCMHSVNWVELNYKLRERGGEDLAKYAINNLASVGVPITEVSGKDFLLLVAKIKVAHPYLSLGDSYAIALSHQLKGTIVTADKPFAKAADFCKVMLIR